MKDLAILLLAFGCVSCAAGQALPDKPSPVPLPDPAWVRLQSLVNEPSKMPQAQPFAVPKGTSIVLISLDWISSQTETLGTKVRFVVVRDVVINGTVIVPAGHEVNGVVTRVKGWSAPESQTGKLTIRINPIAIGNTRLRLTSSEPDPGNVFQKTRDAVYGTGLCVIFLPLCVAIKAMAHSDSRDERGSASLRSCVPMEFWVKSSTTIPATQISQAPPDQMTGASSACPNLKLPLQTSFSPAYLPGVKFK
jgi:hypothetical protein